MRLFLSSTAIFLTFATLATATPVEICLFEEEDWPAALDACNEALAATDDPVERGRFVLHRGIAHEALGDLQAARMDQVLVTQYRPDWFRGYVNAAILSTNMEDMEGALRWGQAAIDAEPDNPRSYGGILYALSFSDDPDSCAPYADQAISLLPHPIDWPFNIGMDEVLLSDLGRCLYGLDRHEEAHAAYRAAEFLGYDHSSFLSDYAGMAYYTLEDDPLAVELATRALEAEEPSLYDVRILIGANVFQDDYAAALAAEARYADVLDAEDQSDGTRNHLAWTMYLNGEVEAASGVIERWVASLGPEHQGADDDLASTWDTVAHIRAALDNPTGALEAFEQSLALDTDEYDERRPETYRNGLEALGISVAPGREGLLAGLADCVEMGAACRLFFDDDEAAQAAE